MINIHGLIYGAFERLKPFFFSDLNTFHKSIADNTFTEKIAGLDGKILPAIAAVTGTSQLQFTDLSGVSITSSDGTSTPSISGNNIEFTVGTCANLLLDDGTFIPDVYSGYDTAGSNDATVVNITKDYSVDGSLHKKNIGYSLYENAAKDKWQVPFLLTGIPKTNPTVPDGYTKTRDVAAGGSNHNLYDSLVDFNYGDIYGDFPFKDLTFLWNGLYDSNDLVNEIGINIPYVSGTGLDQIFDFSVLNDVRLDKSNATYWGAPLDAYFYYDAGNPYHAKLKDFHYFYTEKQMDGLVTYNTIFLKAKATTNLSNEIDTVESLLIYSIAQTSDNLTKLKTYIGIQADFWGDNIVENGDFSEGIVGSLPTNWEGDYLIKSIQETGISEDAESTFRFAWNSVSYDFSVMPKKGKLILDYNNSLHSVISVQARTSTFGYIDYLYNGTNKQLTGDGVVEKDFTISNSSTALLTICLGVLQGYGFDNYCEWDNVRIFLFYENYYESSEI